MSHNLRRHAEIRLCNPYKLDTSFDRVLTRWFHESYVMSTPGTIIWWYHIDSTMEKVPVSCLDYDDSRPITSVGSDADSSLRNSLSTLLYASRDYCLVT